MDDVSSPVLDGGGDGLQRDAKVRQPANRYKMTRKSHPRPSRRQLSRKEWEVTIARRNEEWVREAKVCVVSQVYRKQVA